MRAIATAAGLLVLLQVPACAKDLVRRDGRFVHRELGFSIDEPGGSAEEGSDWRAISVEGSLLSFREPGGSTMSLVQKCGPLPEDLQLLARELLIGLEGREVVEEGGVTVDGAPGWAMAVRATDEGRAARLWTVTRLLGECSLDWILVVPGSGEAFTADFADWWDSFREAPDREDPPAARTATPPAPAPTEASPGAGGMEP